MGVPAVTAQACFALGRMNRVFAGGKITSTTRAKRKEKKTKQKKHPSRQTVKDF